MARFLFRPQKFSATPQGNPETQGQVVPLWTEPKGIDRYHSSSRVDGQLAVKIRNLMFDDGVLASRLGTDLMGAPAASKVMQVVDLVRKGYKKVTVRFCIRHLEIFEYTSGSWRSFPIPLTGTEKDFFAYTGWADKLLFSNGVDGLWEYDFRTTEIKLVPEGPSAKHLTTFGNRVVASSTTQLGNSFPLRVQWTAKNIYTRWNESTEAVPLTSDLAGGHEDLYGSPTGVTDEAMGVFPFSDEQAFLVRSHSTWQMSVSGNVLAPFRFSRIFADIGTPYRNGIVSVSSGIVFPSREDIHYLTSGGHERIGTGVIDDIIDEVDNFNNSYAAWDVGRQEYRIAIDKFVWRWRFQEKGWTADHYPFEIRSLSRQIQGIAGIPIDSLPAVYNIESIDQLPGSINSLVDDRSSDNAMMFVPESTSLTVRETDDPRDTLLTGEETESEFFLDSGVLHLDALHGVELLEIHGEYESQMEQELVFKYSFTDGRPDETSWLPLSRKSIEETLGSEIFFVKQERVSRKFRLRVCSGKLGKLRLLGVAVILRKVERAMASNKPKPARIEILPNPVNLYVGGTQQLSIRVLSVGGQEITGLNVTLLSSNNSIATVSSTGLVRAIAPGSFTIVATVRNIQNTASGTVTAVTPVAVASVAVNPVASQGVQGSQQQYSATVRDASNNILLGRTVNWASSNAAFATINSGGLATLVAPGALAISATVEGVTGGSSLTVTPSAAVVASVQVVPATFSGEVGDTIQLTALPKDASANVLSGKLIAWTSSAPGVATVNATGVVTFVGAGSVTITATCETVPGTSTGTITAAPVAVYTVTVTPAAFTKAVGQTQLLTVVTKDASGNVLTGRPVSFLSSNTAIATVNSTGLVTAVASGSVTITAWCEGKNGTSNATISVVPVASVVVSPSSFSINAGTQVQLTATPKDAANNPLTGRTVVWGSSNPTIATVDSTGKVTGVALGSAIISATSETKVGISSGTIAAGVYSPVNAPASVVYSPEPNPAGVVAQLPTAYVSTNIGAMPLTYASTVSLIEQGSRAQNSAKLQQYIDEAAARAGHSRINIADNVQVDHPITRFHAAGNYYTDIMWPNLPVVDINGRVSVGDMVGAPTFWAVFGSDTAVAFDRKANNTRFNGIKFKANLGITIYDLIFVSPRESGSIDYDTDIANIPTNIHFNQCLAEGNDSGNGVNSGNVRNGFTLNARSGSVTNSYVHQIGWTGNESHAIIVYNTPGPVKIVNNYIEGTSCGVFIGGDVPHYGRVEGRPHDIECRRNEITRRLQWAKDSPSWDGVPGRGIKNLFETKNIVRMLFEGNVLHGNWADAQTGMAVVIKSGLGISVDASGIGTQDVVIRHNLVYDSIRCWNFQGIDDIGVIPAKQVACYNNMAYRIGSYAGQNPGSISWLLSHTFDDLFIAHNTTILNGNTNTMQLAYSAAGGAKSQRLVFKDNIAEFAYVWSDGIVGTAGINNWASSYTWERNVVIMDPANWSIHPAGTNQFDDTQADIGFVNLGALDLTLDPASPYKGDGEGGSDPGCDVTKMNLATSNVLASVVSPCSIVTTKLPVTQTTFLKPAYNSPINEPDFGTKFVRVTGDVGVAVPVVGGTWPNKIYHNYSKDQPWSADQGLIAIKQTSGAFGANSLILDGTTYAPLFTRAGPSGGGEWRMHPTLADIAISISSGGVVSHWNIRTNVTTTKFAAVAGYTGNEMGPSEGNASYDGSKIVISSTRTSDGHRVARVVNIDAGTAGPIIDLTAANISSLDWVSMSAGGGYVVAYGVIDGSSQRLKVWNSTTGAAVSYFTDYTFGHNDLGIDQAGNEVVFGVVGQSPYSHHPIMRRLSDGTITDLGDAWSSFNWHASTRATGRPGWGYLCVNDDTGYPFDLEVFAVKLDGSKSVERLGRHRTNNTDYDSAAFACPSPNGKRVMFASNWGDATGRPVGAYVIDVRDICP